MSYLVAIDTGVSAGVAVFEYHSKKLLHARVISGRGGSWQSRIENMGTRVTETVRSLTRNGMVFRIVCEYPAFIPTAGGIKVAKRGDLVKLAHAVGATHAMLYMTYGDIVELVPVRDWKGQVSKDVINNRVARIVPQGIREAAGMSVKCSHDWDAVGIGLWALGRMNNGSEAGTDAGTAREGQRRYRKGPQGKRGRRH